MAITEKKLEKIRKGFEKSNSLVMKAYKLSGDTSLLEMLYLDSEDPNEVAEKFDIPLEVAEKLVEKDKAINENPSDAISDASEKISSAFSMIFGKTEKSELYDKAFEFVASSGKEDPEALAEALGISLEQAESLIEEMRSRGDIASEDESEDFEEDDTDDDSDDDFDDDDINLSDFPEKIIEALSFVGDVIQDTSEKICDALDESVERIEEHDFDF